MYEILDRINSPADLKSLNPDQLEELCKEIRSYMVDCCSRNPGHLASSLGAVELIVGFHYVFNSPEDSLVFDVGHQAYAHKIITGRREAFRTARTKDGISGFPRRDESEHDAFGVGHSSTSISAALGLSEAARQTGRDSKVVALIGDGALTGGMAFEALNNAGISKSDLLVILNDNNQSIDGNRGGIHEYLLKITTSNRYNNLKNLVWDGLGDSKFRGRVQRSIRSVKTWAVRPTGGDLFESLGFRYFGPIDGNDLRQVISALTRLKSVHGPRILHAMTVKGKGYAPAEADPVVWHAPGKFDPETGKRLAATHSADRYQDVFGAVLCELAAEDKRVVGITPAMASGCGMNVFAEKFPERFYDVGIEEEHAVTFSAGLAAGGLRPFCNIYSAFSQRAYDQIIHDVALQHLPVVLCFDRAGLVGEDGATHHGAFDIAAYRSIPGVVVSAPADEMELRNLMHTALRYEAGPFIIRYPRGMGEGVQWRESVACTYEIGKAETLLEGSDVAVVVTGPFCRAALKVAERVGGGRIGVYDFRFVKPLDTGLLREIAGKYKAVLTVEDGCLAGGLFGAVCEYVEQNDLGIRVHGTGIPDEFIIQGRQSEERAMCGLDEQGIFEAVSKIL